MTRPKDLPKCSVLFLFVVVGVYSVSVITKPSLSVLLFLAWEERWGSFFDLGRWS